MRWLDRLTGWWPNPFVRARVGFRGGVQLAPEKRTKDAPIEPLPLPDCLVVPVKQHIGARCTPVVKPGEHVKKGQPIARADEYLAADVHAPTSGKITKIEEHRVPHPSGLGLPCIFIEPDGEDAPFEDCTPIPDWRKEDPARLREFLRRAGIVGMGGAGFPTFAKLAADRRHPVHTLILNGAECEPYLTSDERLMREEAATIARGAAILVHVLGAARVIAAVEDHKPEAAHALEEALAHEGISFSVRLVPTVYPHGSEKQLIEALLGEETPHGGLPLDLGVVCQNVSTAHAVARAMEKGEPLVARVITVSGDACPRPGNYRVRIGTPVRFVLAHAGITDPQGVEIIHGGPMMGERIPWPEVPIVKNTIGILALAKETFRRAHQPEEPCIRCGRCGQSCPVGLVPNLLAEACRDEDVEEAEALGLFDCIECGCCAYVCPAHIPLVHYFRFGKGLAAEVRRARAFAEASRRRTEARKARLAREKAEREARRRAQLARAKEAARKLADEDGEKTGA